MPDPTIQQSADTSLMLTNLRADAAKVTEATAAYELHRLNTWRYAWNSPAALRDDIDQWAYTRIERAINEDWYRHTERLLPTDLTPGPGLGELFQRPNTLKYHLEQRTWTFPPARVVLRTGRSLGKSTRMPRLLRQEGGWLIIPEGYNEMPDRIISIPAPLPIPTEFNPPLPGAPQMLAQPGEIVQLNGVPCVLLSGGIPAGAGMRLPPEGQIQGGRMYSTEGAGRGGAGSAGSALLGPLAGAGAGAVPSTMGFGVGAFVQGISTIPVQTPPPYWQDLTQQRVTSERAYHAQFGGEFLNEPSPTPDRETRDATTQRRLAQEQRLFEAVQARLFSTAQESRLQLGLETASRDGTAAMRSTRPPTLVEQLAAVSAKLAHVCGALGIDPDDIEIGEPLPAALTTRPDRARRVAILPEKDQ